MDTSLQQEEANISQLLSKDYYEKFKMGQNLYEASMTLSRLSLGDKTSEDFNNNTQFKMMNIQERLSEELYKNQVWQLCDIQLLENKIQNLQSQLQSSIEHTTMLQRQNENKQNEIVTLTQRCEKLSKNYDVEKLLNAQMSKKIVDLQEQIKVLQKGLPFSERKHQKSKQSISSRKEKNHQGGLTEDSTIKDTSVSDLKSLDKPIHAATAQNFYKSTTNFWSPQTQSMAKNQTLEKRIEATLSQIRAIKQQFQQLHYK